MSPGDQFVVSPDTGIPALVVARVRRSRATARRIARRPHAEAARPRSRSKPAVLTASSAGPKTVNRRRAMCGRQLELAWKVVRIDTGGPARGAGTARIADNAQLVDRRVMHGLDGLAVALVEAGILDDEGEGHSGGRTPTDIAHEPQAGVRSEATAVPKSS